MKKVVSLLLVLAMCTSLLMAFTSCSAKHPIDEFKIKMVKANSYQMVITMSDIPLFGTISLVAKVDGNIQYTPAFMFQGEQYTETDGDVKYTYTKDDDGNWTKEKGDADDDDSDFFGSEEMKEIFNSENYEKVEGKENTYKQKSDVEFDEFEDVTITIEEDSCTIEGKVTSDGMTCKMKVEISKIGEIELTLPEVA